MLAQQGLPPLGFHVVEDPVEVQLFEELRAGCYERHGVTLPMYREGPVRRLVARRPGAAPLAGIRLHPRTAGTLLPLEAVLGDHPVLRAELAARQAEGVAELSGLWSTAELGGTGIGAPLVRAAIELARELRIRHLVGFGHQFNRFPREAGFQRDARIGEHAFPDARYRSSIHWFAT